MFSVAGPEQVSWEGWEKPLGRTWEGTRIYCLPVGSHVGIKITKTEQVEIGSQLRRLVIFLSRVDGACLGLATVEEAEVGGFFVALKTKLTWLISRSDLITCCHSTWFVEFSVESEFQIQVERVLFLSKKIRQICFYL